MLRTTATTVEDLGISPWVFSGCLAAISRSSRGILLAMKACHWKTQVQTWKNSLTRPKGSR